MAMEPAGRALYPAGRVLEPAGKVLELAGRAIEPTKSQLRGSDMEGEERDKKNG